VEKSEALFFIQHYFEFTHNLTALYCQTLLRVRTHKTVYRKEILLYIISVDKTLGFLCISKFVHWVNSQVQVDTSYLQFLAKCKDGKGGKRLIEQNLHAIYLSKRKDLII
jgi:hypothetical protein